jgi:REP element-mobilizing transposase RayT
MIHLPYHLDEPRRVIVLTAVRERCKQNGWIRLAAHVRTNHVHIIIDAEAPPERVMKGLKSYASRRLNHEGLTALAASAGRVTAAPVGFGAANKSRAQSFTSSMAKAKR